MLPYFLMVVHTLAVGPGFSYASCLPFALLWALGILVQLAFLLQWSSLPSRWGHPCWVVDCLSSIGTKVCISIWVSYAGQFLAGHPASVCGYQGVLPGGPPCVLTLRLTLALSRVLRGPLLGLSVASPALARGLGWSFVPYRLFCRLGLVPRSVAQLCALQPLVPSFRVYLSEAVGFGGFLGSLLYAPLTVGLLPGSPNRLCPLSAACLLGLEPSPSGVASASDGRFSWHPGAAGALAVPSLRLRVSESSSLSAWSFPFRGL